MKYDAFENGLILPVLLCGGEGKRLRPLLGAEKPKQFLNLLGGERNLFGVTLSRTLESTLFLPPFITANIRHKAYIDLELTLLNEEPVLFWEPENRNTGAPVLMAACYAYIRGIAQLMILPCDHYIDDLGVFHSDIRQASNITEQPIVYLGIPPDQPSSDFGYIGVGPDGIGFHEKPQREFARCLIKNGALWNSGMFLLNTERFMQSCSQIDAATLGRAFSLVKGSVGSHEYYFDEMEYSKMPSTSFDRFYCERTSEGALLEASFAWNDLGSPDRLKRHNLRYGSQNV